MNPLDLPGPQFLVFYCALVAVTALLLEGARRFFESGPVPKLPFVDPYLIAYLRGGAAEAVRVCAFVLFDRDLLLGGGDGLQASERAAGQVRRPLERAIVAALRERRPAYRLLKDDSVMSSAETLGAELIALGLRPSAHDKQRRALLGLGALALLWVVAGLKLAIAYARGKHNVGFLIMLALAAAPLVWLLLRRARTARGDRLLADLRVLFARLRGPAVRFRGGGESQELALLAAVFGLSALPDAQRALGKLLFPKAYSGSSSSSGCGSSCSSSWSFDSGSWSSSSCGSSSSSSSSSSCSSSSSSCGGGGGGSGCGGCGSSS